MKNEKTVVAQAIEQTKSIDAGRLFAQSEVNASESFQLFAEAVGTEPTFQVWEAERVSWVNGYVEIKPKAKGDTAYKAFSRFKDRLVDTYGITVPRGDSKAATKKAEERATKLADTMKRYESTSNDQLHQLVSQAYERQAKNPLGSDSVLKELKTVLKARTKDQQAETKAELKAKRDEVIKAVRECADIERLDLVIEMLSQDNEVSFVTQ